MTRSAAEIMVMNRALQSIGTRTTITAAEFDAGSSNEALQLALSFDDTRDDLLRMAPWDCAVTVTNLTYLTSLPGTPENPGVYNGVWAPGLPIPPWLYEYAYPADCLRACFIIPQQQPLGTATPIFPIATGMNSMYQGPPVKFKVAVDRYLPLNAPVDQRVICTNQQNAAMMYIRQVTDPNVMDQLFTSAWSSLLGSKLAQTLTGDKALAKMLLESANRDVSEARAADGNEGLSTNDVTPDFLRVRGYSSDPILDFGFDWGPLWPTG